MKQNFTYIILAAIVAALLLTACRKDEYKTPYMSMVTSETGSVFFHLDGSGEFTIDCNDDTPPEIFMFRTNGSISIPHRFSTPPRMS